VLLPHPGLVPLTPHPAAHQLNLRVAVAVVSPWSLAQLHARGLVTFLAFSTVRAGNAVCPWGALGYFEVEVLSPGLCTQFGFCSPEWPSEMGLSGNGVGDDGLSWGVDGNRAHKWHQGQGEAFGGPWREGDVVGLACDLRARRMLVSLNGDFGPPYGAAFDLPAAGLEGGLCPALTAQSGLFRCSLGGRSAGRPFRHAPPSPEYLSMAEAVGGDGDGAGGLACRG
jgi:hypothetical protein